MKILIVGPYKSPIIRRLKSNLTKAGLEVRVASHLCGVKDKDYYNLGDLKSYLSYFRFYKLNRIVKHYRPDLIHSHVVNHYGVMSLFSNVPVVIAMWGSDIMLSTYKGSSIKRRILYLINKIVLRMAKICHTSANHIAIEAEKQCKGTLAKTNVFFWGYPLEKLSEERFKAVKSSFEFEFGKLADEIITFNRGVSEIYNPELCLRVLEKLTVEVESRTIVVLRGFSTDDQAEYFKNNIDLDRVVFINRLLTDEELSYLYSKTKIHFSLPVSDSLGGGVIEPALFGSYPILSDLPSYKEYNDKYPSYILSGDNQEDINELVKFIVKGEVGRSEFNCPVGFSAEMVNSQIISVYRTAINK